MASARLFWGFTVLLASLTLCESATFTSPNLTALTTGTGVWRTSCYNPATTSNIDITGGSRFIINTQWSQDNTVAVTLQIYLGPGCVTTPAATAYASFIVVGQELGSQYNTLHLNMTSLTLYFTSIFLLTGFQSSFNSQSSSCPQDIPLYTNYSVNLTQGCGSFLAGSSTCPSRYLQYSLSSGNLSCSSFWSQTNTTAGCSATEPTSDFSQIPAFTLLTSSALVLPTVNITLHSSNQDASYCTQYDTVTVNATSNVPLSTSETPQCYLQGAFSEMQPLDSANGGATMWKATFQVSSYYQQWVQGDLCPLVSVQNFQDTNGNQGSTVTGCVSGQLFFTSIAPLVTYASYEANGVYLPQQVDNVKVTFLLETAGASSYTNSQLVMLINMTQTVHINFDSIDANGNANYVYTIQHNDSRGNTTLKVYGIESPAGLALNGQAFGSGNGPTIVNPYPRLSSAVLSGLSVDGIQGDFLCSDPSSVNLPIHILLVPYNGYFNTISGYSGQSLNSKFAVPSDGLSFFNMFSNGGTGSNATDLPCHVNAGTGVQTLLANFSFGSWYTFAYIAYYKGSTTPAMSPTVSVAGTVYTTSNPKCFSASSTVLLEGGLRKQMTSLAVGDRILSATITGQLEFSDVVWIHSHQQRTVFLDIHYASALFESSLRITPGHLIFKVSELDPAAAASLVPAHTLRVGDTILIHSSASGGLKKARISFIAPIAEQIAFSPITMNGRVIVDGAFCSCYGDNGEWLGHFAHSFHRMLFRLHPALVQSRLARLMESAAVTFWHSMTKHALLFASPSAH